MKEQQKSLEQMHSDRNRINSALEKANAVAKDIGTSAFNERFDLSKLQGQERFLDAAIKVGRVKRALKERAIPKLRSQKERTEEEIENNPRVQKAKNDTEEIRRYVQEEILPGSALEEAERVLANLRQGLGTAKAPYIPAYLRLFQRHVKDDYQSG